MAGIMHPRRDLVDEQGFALPPPGTRSSTTNISTAMHADVIERGGDAPGEPDRRLGRCGRDRGGRRVTLSIWFSWTFSQTS